MFSHCNVDVTDMTSWHEGGRQTFASGDMRDDQTQSAAELPQTVSTEKSSSAVFGTAGDLQKQLYMMGNSHQYPPFHGPLPPYLAMRPGVKPPAVGRLPFHMGQVPMMPPNYSALMMTPFVRIVLLVVMHLMI